MVPNKVLFSNWQLKVRGALATFYKTRNQAWFPEEWGLRGFSLFTVQLFTASVCKSTAHTCGRSRVNSWAGCVSGATLSVLDPERCPGVLDAAEPGPDGNDSAGYIASNALGGGTSNSHPSIRSLGLTEQEQGDLVAFLRNGL